MKKDEDNPIISADRPVEEMIVRMTAFLVGAISVVGRKGELVGFGNGLRCSQGPSFGEELRFNEDCRDYEPFTDRRRQRPDGRRCSRGHAEPETAHYGAPRRQSQE